MGSVHWVVAKVVCSCLCLFDAIVELHAMDEKCSMTFSLEVKVNFISNKGLLNSRFLLCICSGVIYHIN
jgi:hypothetical protein